MDPASLAAYLEGSLPEDEREELWRLFAGSPAAMAELVSAMDLLEATEGLALRPPASVDAKARAILAEGVTQAPVSSWRSWLVMPRLQLAAGFAVVALVAVAVYRPRPADPAQARFLPSVASNPSASSPASSMLPGQIGAPAGARVWGALAVSRATNAYGVAQAAGSRDEAEKAALNECTARRGTDCVIVEEGPAQCFALAREIDGPPVTAAAGDVQTARKRATDACTSRRREIFPCAVQVSFCAER